MTTLLEPVHAPPRSWTTALLDGFESAGITHLPYLPDKPLASVVNDADQRDELTTIPLTREEEGVGIAVGLNLSGRRSALMMQASGMGNSLNAIGSVAMAQRIPLLCIVTERGGLGETVSTQVPFGAALPRVLDAMAVRCIPLTAETNIDDTVALAADLVFTARQVVVLHVTAGLIKGRPRHGGTA